MQDWQDMPEWLTELVAGPGAAAAFLAWERIWKPELAKRDITPDMLGYIGDPKHPSGIDVSPPSMGWVHAPLEYDAQDQPQVIEAISRLVQTLDARAQG